MKLCSNGKHYKEDGCFNPTDNDPLAQWCDECKKPSVRMLKLQGIKEHVNRARALMYSGEEGLWINALYELEQAKVLSDELIAYDVNQLSLLKE